jgi:hypothetical protein
LRGGEGWGFAAGTGVVFFVVIGVGRTVIRQGTRSFTFAARPFDSICGICAEIPPEGKAAQERAIAARDVAPGTFAPAEDRDVGEAHEALAERGHEGDGEDGVLGESVRIRQAVADERDEPHQHIYYGVDEEDAELALDGAAALALGAVAEGGVGAALGGDAVAAGFGYGGEDAVWGSGVCYR